MLEFLARRMVPICAAVVAIAVFAWAVYFPTRPEADFTFVNGTEIMSIDPAIVSGQPEGRIIWELYEPLVDWNPETLAPEPGVAERWELSPDGRTLTFFLRKDAYWTKLYGPGGRPERQRAVNAHDFLHSFRRLLDPTTGAEYSMLLYHVVGGKEYNTGEVEVGQAVEVELTTQAEGSLPHARNEVLHGKLTAIETLPAKEGSDDAEVKIHVVEIDGQSRRFVQGAVPAAAMDATPCRQILRDFSTVGIHALDDWTLEFQLKHNVPYFLNLFGFYCLSPTQPECLETHGYPAWTQPENLVSNGPFLLESRRVRDRIRMVKNPHYWDVANIHLDIVDALAVQSSTTGLNMYLTGQVDFIPTVPASIAPDLLAQGRKDFDPNTFLAVYYYEINVTKQPLDNALVRRALDLAIDKNKLVNQVTQCREVPAGRYVPPKIPDYDLYKAIHQVPDYAGPNIPLAKKLLAEAGYPDGQGFPKFELLYNTEDTHAVIAQYIQAQWKENLNINCELVNKEWASYLADRRGKNYFIARAGWIGDYTDPMTFMDLYESDNPQNRAGFKNLDYDKLLKATFSVALTPAERERIIAATKAAPGYDPAKHDKLWTEIPDLPERMQRMQLFYDAEQKLVETQALIPIYTYVSKMMVRDWVSGFYPNIQDVHPLKGVRVDKAMRRKFLEAEGRL